MPPTTTCGRARKRCAGWDYRSVLPYFKRAEDNQRFADDFHAYGGPLGVSMPVSALPICDAYIRAGQELGIPYNHDFNGAQQAGVGFYQLTQRDRRRSSAAMAYLAPIKARKNLTVRTAQAVLRIVVENAPRRRCRAGRERRAKRGDPGGARGACRFRRDRLAEAHAAIRHRSGRSSVGGRRSGEPRSARRRRQSAGSSRPVRHLGMHRRPHL